MTFSNQHPGLLALLGAAHNVLSQCSLLHQAQNPRWARPDSIPEVWGGVVEVGVVVEVAVGWGWWPFYRDLVV